MSPLEQQQAAMIARGKVQPDELTKWSRRLLAGGAVYFLLGGREVRVVTAAGVIYYLVQKKVIQEKQEQFKEDVKDKGKEMYNEIKNRLFGKKNEGV